jgi:Tfp pilus assembly protein PilF
LLGTTLLLVGTELALRVVGFGDSAHFARRDRSPEGKAIVRENRWCTAPFFGRERVRRPQPFRLEAEKPANTVRIFVLGSSAAMGDPEPSFSLSRMLEAMLRHAYPGQRFEVINAGITAINSHVLRGIAEDCADLQPDLFVVYEGHNEVIGPFGPAGVFAPFYRGESAVRFAAWAQTTRTGQLASRLATAASPRTSSEEWGGMQMFLQQQIRATDPRLSTMRAHFRANLLTIAEAARRRGAATLLCTVVTNQRDFAPFLSLHRAGLTATERAEWTRHFEAATAAQRAADLVTAEREFRAALAVDDEYAELIFRLGRLLLQQGRDAEAATLLQRALDQDALRFRTDSKLNEVIREVAATTPGAALVDLAAELARTSAHGSPGDDLLYEHVHLNFRGTYEAATHLLPHVISELTKRGRLASPAGPRLTIEEAREQLAYTTYEQAMIGAQLLKRFRAPPFTGQIDDALRIETWERRLESAGTLLSQAQATDALAALYERARASAPADWVLARNAGAMLIARGRPQAAIPLLEKARSVIPDDADTLVALGLAQKAAGQPEVAAATFALVRRLEPRHPLLPP